MIAWLQDQFPLGHTMLSSLALAWAMNSLEAPTRGSRGGPMGMPETKVITALVCATPKPGQTKAKSGYLQTTFLKAASLHVSKKAAVQIICVIQDQPGFKNFFEARTG